MASSKSDVNVIFLGPTGCGKSRLCNFLLENDTMFNVTSGFESVTKHIQIKSKLITDNNESIVFKFIDTQGLADTTMTSGEVISIVNEVLKKDITHVNYLVIILKPGRITDENRKALEYIIKAFKLDDEERKKHVLFVLSHCEVANERLRQKYKEECLADRTIKQLLVIKDTEINNCFFTGLPQPDEVNESMFEGIMKCMEVQRKEIMKYLSQPIEGIQLDQEAVKSLSQGIRWTQFVQEKVEDLAQKIEWAQAAQTAAQAILPHSNCILQ